MEQPLAHLSLDQKFSNDSCFVKIDSYGLCGFMNSGLIIRKMILVAGVTQRCRELEVDTID